MPHRPKSARRALSWGLVANGGQTSDNAALVARIREIDQRLLDLPPADGNAAVLVVAWSVGGDIYSPDAPGETVRVESCGDRMLGADVLIPYARFGPEDADRCVKESLARVLEQAERLVAKRKLGWDLSQVRAAAAHV